jgi:hypothetical protein
MQTTDITAPERLILGHIIRDDRTPGRVGDIIGQLQQDEQQNKGDQQASCKEPDWCESKKDQGDHMKNRAPDHKGPPSAHAKGMPGDHGITILLRQRQGVFDRFVRHVIDLDEHAQVHHTANKKAAQAIQAGCVHMALAELLIFRVRWVIAHRYPRDGNCRSRINFEAELETQRAPVFA